MQEDSSPTSLYSPTPTSPRPPALFKYFENMRSQQQPVSSKNPSDIRNEARITSLQTSSKLKAATNYKDFFQLFDRRGRGQCELKCLGDLLRSCGQNPSLKEIKELEGQIKGDFDFDTFSKILNRPGGFKEPGTPEEYCKGFQVFDKDLTGYIGVGQFRYILTHLGEPMTDEEVDNVLKHIDTPNDEVNYLDFVKKILAG